MTNWTGWDKEMQAALREDAAKLSAITGDDHTVEFFSTEGDMTPPTDQEMAARKSQWEREALEPTPLPWRIEHDKQWDGEPLVRILGANDDTVADNTQYYPHDIKEADAEFIVLRVNSHRDLVAALDAARPLIVSEWDEGHGVVRQIDAALALARGGK